MKFYKFCLVLALSLNFCQGNDKFHAEIVTIKDEKIGDIEYSVKIVKTSDEAINRHLRKLFCGNWSFSNKDYENDWKGYDKWKDECSNLPIEQIVDIEVDDIKRVIAEYKKTGLQTRGIKAFEQEFKYFGDKYFEVCSLDYNHNDYSGNQDFMKCFFYDISNPKEPKMMDERNISHFLSEKQLDRLIAYFAIHGIQFGFISEKKLEISPECEQAVLNQSPISHYNPAVYNDEEYHLLPELINACKSKNDLVFLDSIKLVYQDYASIDKLEISKQKDKNGKDYYNISMSYSTQYAKAWIDWVKIYDENFLESIIPREFWESKSE